MANTVREDVTTIDLSEIQDGWNLNQFVEWAVKERGRVHAGIWEEAKLERNYDGDMINVIWDRQMTEAEIDAAAEDEAVTRRANQENELNEYLRLKVKFEPTASEAADFEAKYANEIESLRAQRSKALSRT